MPLKKKIITGVILLLFMFLFGLFIQKPSLDRDWTLDQKILSEVTFSGNIIDIKNIRNFKYESETKYQIFYYDKKFDLNTIKSVYYIIEPFSKYDGPAHTMLSFGFDDGSYLTVSSEIRKEKGESFSPFLGLFNKYEIVYILGDENDLIKLRANYRKDDVFMYPIKASKENIGKLFISALERANKLAKEPEFYNTITNTCLTSILEHVNVLMEDNGKEIISWSKEIFLPSNSDKIAYDLGLIDTNLSLEEAKKYYQINKLSEQFGDNINYSKLIRKEIK